MSSFCIVTCHILAHRRWDRWSRDYLRLISRAGNGDLISVTLTETVRQKPSKSQFNVKLYDIDILHCRMTLRFVVVAYDVPLCWCIIRRPYQSLPAVYPVTIPTINCTVRPSPYMVCGQTMRAVISHNIATAPTSSRLPTWRPILQTLWHATGSATRVSLAFSFWRQFGLSRGCSSGSGGWAWYVRISLNVG